MQPSGAPVRGQANEAQSNQRIFGALGTARPISLIYRLPASSSFSETVQLAQRLAWNLKAIAVRPAHLDNVPLGGGSRFAKVENLFIKIAVEGFVLMFFDMDAAGASRKFLEHRNRVAIAGEAVAHVHLHVDF